MYRYKVSFFKIAILYISFFSGFVAQCYDVIVPTDPDVLEVNGYTLYLELDKFLRKNETVSDKALDDFFLSIKVTDCFDAVDSYGYSSYMLWQKAYQIGQRHRPLNKMAINILYKKMKNCPMYWFEKWGHPITFGVTALNSIGLIAVGVVTVVYGRPLLRNMSGMTLTLENKEQNKKVVV